MTLVDAEPRGAGLPDAASVLAQASAENFPVASRLLPARERADLMNLYGFARLVDDVGDEASGDRSALLDAVEAELDAIYGGTPTHPLMVALARTVHAHAIPRDPFARLIAANRQDQVVTRYADFDALVGYCRLSADPVGELVLHVFGRATPDRIALSDRVCTALQVVEHLQDVGEDYRNGRVYLPQADLARLGCDEAELGAPTASPALRAVLALEAAQARRLLTEGAPLIRRLPPRPALAVAAFVGGGRAALDALSRGRYDVLGARPRPSRGRLAATILRTLVGVAR
jgi:squalene synthase HpnC